MREVFRHGVDEVEGGYRHGPGCECVDPQNPNERGDTGGVSGDDADGVGFLTIFFAEMLCEVVNIEEIVDGEEQFDQENRHEEWRFVLQFLQGCWEDEGAEEFGIKQNENGFRERFEAMGLGLELERVGVVLWVDGGAFESPWVFLLLTSDICLGANLWGEDCAREGTVMI